MNTDQEKTLRSKYFGNQIFQIGTIVEDINTKEEMKILDRGSNYLTVATKNGIIKKWLNEVVEIVPEVITEVVVPKVINPEFKINECGQIELFGYETKNFTQDLSELVLEQFAEFTDLYSKHQIIKCLDIGLSCSDTDTDYAMLNKVDEFYSKNELRAPLIVEVMKNDIERTRITQILATVAGVKATQNNAETMKVIIKALKDKYKTHAQWKVLNPFFRIAADAGMVGVLSNLPYPATNEETSKSDLVIEILDENLALLLDEITDADLGELGDITNSNQLLEQAMKCSTCVLTAKLNGLAPDEAFDTAKTRPLVLKLAHALIPKIKALASAKIKHTETPVSPTASINGGVC